MTTKKNKRFFVQILVDSFPDSHFKHLRGNAQEKVSILAKNLWGMFTLKDIIKYKKDADLDKIILSLYGINSENLSVSHFAWSETVKKNFYNHPYHQGIEDMISKNGMLLQWTLNYEPSDLNSVSGEYDVFKIGV